MAPDQEQTKAREDEDVVAVLRRAHGEVLALLVELEATPTLDAGGSAADVAKRISIVDALVGILSAHEAAEEEIFWPAVADGIDAGPSIAQLGRAREREGRRALEELRRAEKGDTARFESLVERTAESLRDHVAFEEEVFERVTEQISEPARRSLGGRVARAMRHGPTRPHPRGPSGAVALHVAAPLTGAVDRLRDRVTNRPAEQLDDEVLARAHELGRRLPPPRHAALRHGGATSPGLSTPAKADAVRPAARAAVDAVRPAARPAVDASAALDARRAKARHVRRSGLDVRSYPLVVGVSGIVGFSTAGHAPFGRRIARAARVATACAAALLIAGLVEELGGVGGCLDVLRRLARGGAWR